VPEPETGPLLSRGAVAAADREALATAAAVVVRPGLARFRLTGTARLECLQGLVTCDIGGAADGTHQLGALLTAKGMIVAPLWITRLSDAVFVEAPALAAPDIAAVFARSLPPRLCRAEDETDTNVPVGVYGPAADAVLTSVLGGAPPPGIGHAAVLGDGPARVVVARVAARGVAGFECAAPARAAGALVERLASRGAAPVAPALLEERRILSGFPRLGAEIDGRTLPQEVDLDRLGAVSYTKGCYLGQETVARVHFRGHANRRLAGLALEREPARLPLDVMDAGRTAGRLTSACWWQAGGGWVGLAVLRRGLEEGRAVQLADGAAATIQPLPWEPPAAAPGDAP
jgi:folate-binding protein YgfZ